MKFRVLCLHGYTQNAQKFRDRTGPFRRALKSNMEMVYVTAPLEATEFCDDTADAGAEGVSAAWWNRSDDKTKEWSEIRQSVRALAQVIRDEGPFDGLVGFSQGAGMAAILAALAHRARAPVEGLPSDVQGAVDDLGAVDFKFAFFFAGFFPPQAEFELLLGGQALPLASMHVVGAADAIVPKERGEELARRAFADAQLAEHAGGHFVPSNAEWRKVYQRFLLNTTS
ncbi:Ovarian cancer-associated protein 2 [Coemansia sp. Benny D115]|nr:Ovarian cancer-associated protein 2 [Coemansia sp. Benny D115]